MNKRLIRNSLLLAPFLLLLVLPFPALAKPTGPGNHTYELQHGGVSRSFLLHVPKSFKQQMPLVIAIHGGGGDGKGMQTISGWDEKAEAEGFLVAYPDGVGKQLNDKTLGSWNGGRCCPPASTDNIDDVGFIAQMIDLIARDFSIDLRRVYATGHSNGAIMAYRLACDLSEKITAIGPMGAQGVFESCDQKRAVPIFHIHGKDDPCARYNGGECGGCFTDYLNKLMGLDLKAYKWQCDSVPESMNYWRKKYQLRDMPRETYRNGAARCETFSRDTSSLNEVTLCTVSGMGHAYPGGSLPLPCRRGIKRRACQLFLSTVGPTSADISPTEILWDFFRRQRL